MKQPQFDNFWHPVLEGSKIIPQKRIPERIVGQIDDVPVPQTLNEIVKVGKAIKIVPRESISGRICEQIVDAPVSHTLSVRF